MVRNTTAVGQLLRKLVHMVLHSVRLTMTLHCELHSMV